MTWPAASEEPTGALVGVRVLDLSRILAGPFCTSILADLGADVIKVERPGTGDETRRWGPPFAPTGIAAYFYSCNHGRRSITLDFRDDGDREIVLELAGEADVVIENFLPGTLERLGLGHEVLRESNPALVYCVISGYGQDSSRASWPALDFVIQAHAGILGVTGARPEEPVKAGIPIADLSAGLFATIGVLAGLRRVERTGEGAHIEVSLADACVALLANQAMNYLIGGADPEPRGNVHPNAAPYQTIMARDGLLALAAMSEKQFQALCNAVGLPELVEDDRFGSNADRVANREALERRLGERLAERTAADWVRDLNEAGVAAAEVNSVGEVLEDPDTRARLVTSVRDGDHEIPQIRTPIRVDGEPLEIAGTPPHLGADDDEVRARLRAPR
jgi:crotonobetainyl-CoA:carnitine CoA-transferase CaiB-like acyl-CoA transferase